MHPEAHARGIDIDPRILAIARGKIAAAHVDIRLVQGSATDPPLPPASFDRVLTTLVLHHLTTPEKREALAALSFRLFDGDETTGANLRGELPDLIASAGFTDVRETEPHMTPFGTLTYLRGVAHSLNVSR